LRKISSPGAADHTSEQIFTLSIFASKSEIIVGSGQYRDPSAIPTFYVIHRLLSFMVPGQEMFLRATRVQKTAGNEYS
jgi:hypothetical protein